MAGPIFFLSDYGTRDEFVGVVHAVLAASAPRATRHRSDASDPRLRRPCRRPHLGPRRRRIWVRVSSWPWSIPASARPAGDCACSARRSTEDRPSLSGRTTASWSPRPSWSVVGRSPGPSSSRRRGPADDHRGTFDGRDLFAPAAAALCRGTRPELLGEAIDPGLTGPPPARRGRARSPPDGRQCLRAEVTWVDHFGNVQLAATLADARRRPACRSWTRCR